MRIFRLPKQVRLGPHFLIKVEVGSIIDAYAEWNVGDSGGVIRLRKGMTIAQQRYHYTHELVHAAIDYHHQENMEGAVV